MKKSEIKIMIQKLLGEIEEEDIGISLFSNFYQNADELDFFCPSDREKVLKILKILEEDSKRHKGIVEQVIDALEGHSHEK